MIGYVAIGGAIGAAARYLVMSRVALWLGSAFPYGTLAVNIFGSVLMGALIVLFARMASVSQPIQAMLTVGMLGGFTTFSTFSLDTVTLIERGEVSAVFLYALLSVIGAVSGLFLGIYVTRLIV